MLGKTGTVIYVGQSRVLRTRLLSYFRATGRRNKAARILRHAFAIEWEYTPTEFGALLRELRLIKQFRPHFNSMMVTDDWPRAYVALTGGPVPGLRVVPRSDDPSAVALFGPFRRVGNVREAVRALADATGLRDCTLDVKPRGDRAARQLPLWFASDPVREGTPVARAAAGRSRTRAPGCLRHELGSCPGPCIGAGDGMAYRGVADEVRAFLEGQSDAPVQRLRGAMEAAAAELNFEWAASLRDRLAHVSWLHERVQRFRANVDRLTFRYEAKTVDGGTQVYLIRRGTVRAEYPKPVTEEGQREARALMRQLFLAPDPTGSDIPTHDLDEFYLVASWFRRRPEEQRAIRKVRVTSPRTP